jgi:hypothetical protein
MGSAVMERSPEKALLVAGFIYAGEEIYRRAKELLSNDWGEMTEESAAIPFEFTDYYRTEMGEGLLRRFAVFSTSFRAHRLKNAKKTAMQVEESLSSGGRRRINIDPGYLTADKLVLATHKQYPFSVAITEGISAVLELLYYTGSYQPLHWTYPDYRQMVEFFNGLRLRFFPRG